MVDWLIKVWRKIQPYWQRVAHAETVVSVWEFIRPFITSPYFWSGIVAVLVIIWSIATSEFGPYAFVAALIGSGGVFWLRNQFKYRSQFLELKQLVTKPPEIQVETQYRDPSGWALMSKVRDRNLAGLVHLLQCQGDWQALPQYKSTPPQVFLFCNYRNKSIY